MNINLNTLKEIIKENKYTYEYVSNKIGYSKPFVWQIVNSERGLSYKNAILIASVFGMKPDDLFYKDFITNNEIRERLK